MMWLPRRSRNRPSRLCRMGRAAGVPAAAVRRLHLGYGTRHTLAQLLHSEEVRWRRRWRRMRVALAVTPGWWPGGEKRFEVFKHRPKVPWNDLRS